MTPHNGNSPKDQPASLASDFPKGKPGAVDPDRRIAAYTLAFDHHKEQYVLRCKQAFTALIEMVILYFAIGAAAYHLSGNPNSKPFGIGLIALTVIVYSCVMVFWSVQLQSARSHVKTCDYYMNQVFHEADANQFTEPGKKRGGKSDHFWIKLILWVLGTTATVGLLFYELSVSGIWNAV